MLTVLLTLCLGMANAARGSGYKLFPFTIPNWKIIPEGSRGHVTSCTKPILLLCMVLVAYTITGNIWAALIFPTPLMWFWAKEGGTGESMPWILSWFHLPFIDDNQQWRAFEFVSVWVWGLFYLQTVILILKVI